jgi:radical SAM protein with 4Fe4S-binding SPASM domain
MRIYRNYTKRKAWLYRNLKPLVRQYRRLQAIRKDILFVQSARSEIAGKKADGVFDLVQIETVNRCINDCAFCPVNRNADPRPYSLMDPSLFESIIGQMAHIKYNRWLGLFSNNEPLLDPSLPQLAAHARSMLPEAKIYIYTNGILLTTDAFVELMQHLDYMVINNYTEDGSIIPTVQQVLSYIHAHPEYESRVVLAVIDKLAIRDTRGGLAANRSRCWFLRAPCAMPFKQLVIRPDGKVSLCCQDVLGAFTMGDLTHQELMAVWRSALFREMRDILERGRNLIPYCGNCDFYSLPHNPVPL